MSETPLLDKMRAWMQADNWPMEDLEGLTAIRSGFQGDDGSWGVFVRSHEDEKQVVCYSILKNQVPEARRPAVAEFMTRANYGMRIGNFEIDLSDGEVRYKTSVDVEGGVLASEMIGNLLNINVVTMNRYFLGLSQVMYSDTSPADAIQAIEG